MTHIPVRQYLTEHGIEADRSDCVHISKTARKYSIARRWPIEHRPAGVANTFNNLYDVRALDAVCKNFRHSETERQCTQCLRMKSRAEFYSRGEYSFCQCKLCFNRRRGKRTFEAREKLRLKNAQDYRRRKIAKYNEAVGGESRAANR